MSDTRVTLTFTMSDGSTQDADFVLHDKQITSFDGSVTVAVDPDTGDVDLSVPAGGGVTSITSEDESVTVVVDDETGAVDLSVPDSGGGSSTVIQSADGSVGVTKDPASNTYDLTVAPMDTWLADVHISVNPQLTVVGEAVSSGITLNLASIQNLHNYDYLYLNLAVIVTTSVATENTDTVSVSIGTSAGATNAGNTLNVLIQNVAEGRIARPIISSSLLNRQTLAPTDILTLYVNTTLQGQGALELPIAVAVQIDGDLYGTNNTEIAHISSSAIPG